MLEGADYAKNRRRWRQEEFQKGKGRGFAGEGGVEGAERKKVERGDGVNSGG